MSETHPQIISKYLYIYPHLKTPASGFEPEYRANYSPFGGKAPFLKGLASAGPQDIQTTSRGHYIGIII